MDDALVCYGSSPGDGRSFGAWVVVLELEEYRPTRIHPWKSRETARNADRNVIDSGRDVSFGIIVTTGRNKVLVGPAEDGHDTKYTHLLEPIRNRYPRLQNRMSKAFYDENQFFSSQMLLGRGEDGPGYIWEELFPAYTSYVETHLKLIETTLENTVKTDYAEVLRRHKAYDDYSSVRDPAHGLLKALFGGDYADSFVYDVLFPLSDRPIPRALLLSSSEGQQHNS